MFFAFSQQSSLKSGCPFFASFRGPHFVNTSATRGRSISDGGTQCFTRRHTQSEQNRTFCSYVKPSFSKTERVTLISSLWSSMNTALRSLQEKNRRRPWWAGMSNISIRCQISPITRDRMGQSGLLFISMFLTKSASSEACWRADISVSRAVSDKISCSVSMYTVSWGGENIALSWWNVLVLSYYHQMCMIAVGQKRSPIIWRRWTKLEPVQESLHYQCHHPHIHRGLSCNIGVETGSCRKWRYRCLFLWPWKLWAHEICRYNDGCDINDCPCFCNINVVELLGTIGSNNAKCYSRLLISRQKLHRCTTDGVCCDVPSNW